MDSRLLPITVACALLTLAGQGFAQGTNKGTQTYNPGPSGSPRCDTMTGAERAQCLNDEGAKTENGIGTPAPAAAPDTSASASTGSQRCDSLTGAEREQCVKDEAQKTDSSSGASSQRDSTR